MIPWLPVSSIALGRYSYHEDQSLEFFEAIGHCEPILIQTHQVLNMMCKLKTVKSRISTSLCLEEIETSSNVVFKDFESDMAGGIGKLGVATRQTAEINVIVELIACS